MWLRQFTAVAVAVSASLAFSEAARSGETTAYAGAIATAAVGALVCPAVALGIDHPDGTSEFERKGWLLNAAGTWAFPTFEGSLGDDLTRSTGTDIVARVNNTVGVNGGAGYRCHRYFATELEFEWISGFPADIHQAGNGKIASFDPDPLTVTTNFKGYLPLGRFQPFALAGGGMMAWSGSVTKSTDTELFDEDKFRAFAVRLGGGFDYYATKHIVLNVGADYVFPLGGQIDLDYVSVGWGIQYRF